MKKKIISCLLAITMMAAWTPPVFASEEGPAVAVWVSKVNASDSGMEKDWNSRRRCSSAWMTV